MLYAFMTLSSFLPLSARVPLAISVQDKAKSFVTISKLLYDKNDNDADNAVLRFLTGHYVEAMESYDYDNNFELLNKNKNLIRQLSLGTIYKDFSKSIDIKNINGKIYKLRRNTKLEIEVLNGRIIPNRGRNFDSFIWIKNSEKLNKVNVNFLSQNFKNKKVYHNNSGEGKYTAFVDFYKTTIKNETKSTTKHRAKLDFIYKTISINKEERKFSPLNFTVFGYESIEIEISEQEKQLFDK